MTLQKIGLQKPLILGHVHLKRKIGILNEYSTKFTELHTIKLKTGFEIGNKHYNRTIICFYKNKECTLNVTLVLKVA